MIHAMYTVEPLYKNLHNEEKDFGPTYMYLGPSSPLENVYCRFLGHYEEVPLYVSKDS